MNVLPLEMETCQSADKISCPESHGHTEQRFPWYLSRTQSLYFPIAPSKYASLINYLCTVPSVQRPISSRLSWQMNAPDVRSLITKQEHESGNANSTVARRYSSCFLSSNHLRITHAISYFVFIRTSRNRKALFDSRGPRNILQRSRRGTKPIWTLICQIA